ncbi:MAG TPA: metallophosphoesterase [Anaerolineae bacterium]
MAETHEHWQNREAAYTQQALMEKLFDVVMRSSAVVLPAGIAAALWQATAGHTVGMAIGLAFAAGGAVGCYARFVQPFWLRVKRLDVHAASRHAPAHSPLKLIFFSDLHVGHFKGSEWVRKVVALVNAQQPDVVLIGGDLVSYVDPALVPDMLAPLKQLAARLGVYAVFGNHDYGLPGHDHTIELQKILASVNVRLLRNECVMLDERMQVIGIDELWSNKFDAERAFSACEGEELPRVVVGHNPDLMQKITRQADLFLFGHTHGGQILVPGLMKHFVPIEGPIFRGMHRLPQGLVYISNGCGESATPTRLGTTVEIVAITFYC